MAKDQFPGFHDWTVEYIKERNEFTFTKEHEAGKNGRLVVVIRGGAETDPDLVFERGKRDALAEDVRVSTEDDKSIWQERFAEADKAVTKRKVLAGIAKGFGQKYAMERLVAAGFSLAEINELIGG